MKLRLKNLLIEPFYFEIDRKGRDKIFKDFNLSNKEISKKIKCSSNTIDYFKNLDKFVRYDILKKLLNLTKIKEEDFEKYVLSIRRGCGNNKSLKVNLPIEFTPGLSLLIGKGFGDGGVSSDYRFFYTNNQKELINEVIKNIETSIGLTKYNIHYKNKTCCYEMKFPSSVGFILYFFGVPKGKKMGQIYDIPNWIKKGDGEVKKMFIRGLFDDESCMRYYGSTRSIILGFGKEKKYKKHLEKFMDSIKSILKEFEISCGKTSLQKEYGNNIILRFNINSRKNLENYKTKIGFSHPKKKEKLDESLRTYIDKQKIKKLILKIVQKNSEPLTINKISEVSGINNSLVEYHLNDLYKKGEINKTTKSHPNLWSKKEISLKNRKEKILDIVNGTPLSTQEISNNSGVKYKYTLSILHNLKKDEIVKNYKDNKTYFWNR